MEEKDKQYLYNWYNATSTADENDEHEIETYENWLERQLIARIELNVATEARVKALEEENKALSEGHDNYKNMYEESEQERIRLEGKVKEAAQWGFSQACDKWDFTDEMWKQFADNHNIKH